MWETWKGDNNMYQCTHSTQYVREHETNYLFQRLGKYYIRTHYAGVCELTKEKYEEYKNKGVVER